MYANPNFCYAAAHFLEFFVAAEAAAACFDDAIREGLPEKVALKVAFAAGAAAGEEHLICKQHSLLCCTASQV